MDEMKEYLKYNALEVRKDVIEMVAKEEIDITINEEFRVVQEAPNTKAHSCKIERIKLGNWQL